MTDDRCGGCGAELSEEGSCTICPLRKEIIALQWQLDGVRAASDLETKRGSQEWIESEVVRILHEAQEAAPTGAAGTLIGNEIMTALRGKVVGKYWDDAIEELVIIDCLRRMVGRRNPLIARYERDIQRGPMSIHLGRWCLAPVGEAHAKQLTHEFYVCPSGPLDRRHCKSCGCEENGDGSSETCVAEPGWQARFDRLQPRQPGKRTGGAGAPYSAPPSSNTGGSASGAASGAADEKIDEGDPI